jgi:hypothetical protein
MLALPYAVHAFTIYGKAHNREEWLRNPLAAALLNLCPYPPGLGYIYLGKWWRFLLVWLGLALVSLAIRLSDAPQVKSVGCLIIFNLSVIMACDAYQIAKH